MGVHAYQAIFYFHLSSKIQKTPFRVRICDGQIMNFLCPAWIRRELVPV